MERTSTIKKRYNRLSSVYNFMEKGMDKALGKWRAKLFARIKDPSVLEVGIGTGANIPYYPKELKFVGIDFSPGMLGHARRIAELHDSSVELFEMDV